MANNSLGIDPGWKQASRLNLLGPVVVFVQPASQQCAYNYYALVNNNLWVEYVLNLGLYEVWFLHRQQASSRYIINFYPYAISVFKEQ